MRRLTPMECGRLQGFPDWWCEGIEIREPSDEQVAEWMKIFETYRQVMGKPGRPYTENFVRKWLKTARSDAREYKMWGNGMAFPCLDFIVRSIREELEREDRE